MDNIFILILIGLSIGTLGTLIGAGGGFILVPVLLLTNPNLSPEIITAVSMAVVAANAISGSIAYIRAGRVDYKAGLIFALFTIPGSILGVLATKYIPRHLFDIIFGILLIGLGIFLFIKGGKPKPKQRIVAERKGWIHRNITDRHGEQYNYSYDWRKGAILSLFVGFLSPLLGIGGGIIHVPALAEWLAFPVHIATATSHFILAIMATVSVTVHFINGNYSDPMVMRMVICLIIGVIPGAQIGARLSRVLKGGAIIKALAVSLALVGLRILFTH
jgi:uncharacterized membrane protein YfcA